MARFTVDEYMDMMFWIGVLIVLVTVVGIVKKVEVRLVLFLSGLVMAILGGEPWAVFDAFASSITSAGLVPVITAAFGFAVVLKKTGCDKELITLLTAPLTKMRPILIPGTVFVTAIISTAISSASGAAAAIGAVLIPALMSSGVKPAVAAAAVVAGTSFTMLNPGHGLNALLYELSEGAYSPVEIVARTLFPAIVGLSFLAVGLVVMALLEKGKKGAAEEVVVEQAQTEKKKVNLLKALVPLIPLIMLIVSSDIVGVMGHEFTVLQAMIIGAAIAWLVDLLTNKKEAANAQDLSKGFFEGMSNGFAKIIGIIAAAAAFTSGLEIIGVTGALIEMMEASTGTVPIAATVGPYFIAALSGSGNAATIAFNTAITPNAALFGLDMIDLGVLANLAGSLGRSISPVAGVTIICATLANVDPIEVGKRNLLGSIIASAVVMFILVIM